MKNKRMILGIAVLVMAAITACGQKSDPEKDFEAKPIDGGKGVEITNYMGEKWEVRIPTRINKIPVTSIGEKAFAEKAVTSVTIPNSVTSIGGGAFLGCTGLSSITIPNSVTSIGGSAFRECTGLASITIPNSVTSIGDSAFAFCTGLSSITIPNSVTSIGGSAFEHCTSLTSVTFEGTITSDNFYLYATFDGDLRAKYLAGGPGTYTTTAPVDYGSNWTKQ